MRTCLKRYKDSSITSSYAKGGTLSEKAVKKNYIRRNRSLWESHKSWLSGWSETVRDFDHSHQKFEWNAGDADATFQDKVIQFRPSGIRVKRGDSSPALVLTKTQVPIVWDKGLKKFRYISPREAARLQSFKDEHILPGSPNDAYKALGNAVNSHVVKMIMTDFVSHFNNR